MTLNKKMLCNRFREIAECTHADANFVVDTITGIIIEELSRDNRVIFGKIGTFSVLHRSERKAYDPALKKEMIIPARPALKIKPSIMMKRLLVEKLSK